MRKVAITGVGVCVPGAHSAEDLFELLSAGRSFISYDKRLASFGIEQIATNAVSDDEIATLDALYPDVAGQLCSSGKMSYHALLASHDNSGLDIRKAGQRCALFYGTHKRMISPEQLFSMWQRYDKQKHRLRSGEENRFIEYQQSKPDYAPKVMAKSIGLQGDYYAYADACAAGSTNIYSGFTRVRSGELDIAVCGAGDEGTQPIWNLVFKNSGALTINGRQLASEVCRPFDKDRTGCVLADGAAFLILEEAEHASSRGANIMAMVSGGSRGSESYKMTSTHSDGRFYKASMEAALADAGLPASAIDHINAHGTATKINDMAEGRAINELFSHDVSVTATKSALGHSLSGSGAIEAVICVLSIQNQHVLPTLNYTSAASNEADLNIVTRSQPQSIEHVLSNSFGFGGLNSSIILSRGDL